ncbi:MAG: undecaprenyl/decaprenyl-phosphate alpha-N-acetylglucosaminyl 1-phosphate transferase [Zoogloea sp.]|nr:undecaprenyl/decaprenyl-phosphate alpha-N-acetylglucosaminyl 1-phosphate transferase [Zoogloea sp.]
MISALSIFFTGFIVSLALTVGVIRFLRHQAHRWGLVDHPGGRKQHDGATPLVGGIAMAVGFVCTLLASPIDLSRHWNLLLGLSLLVSLGVLDDLRDLPAKMKLLWQIAAVTLILVPKHLYIQHLGNIGPLGHVELGLFAIPFTIFSVVGLINAINMADGVDGAAGTIVSISLFWFGVTAALGGHETRLLELVILFGAIIGFLLFNLRTPWRAKAAVFMGDAGSMMLGATLGWFSIKVSQGISTTPASAPPIVVLWILGLPVLDTLLLMARRIRQGRSPLSAGRDHMHHIWLHAGFSPGQTTLILGVIHFLLGGLAVFGWQAGMPESSLFVAYIVVLFMHRYMGRHAWIVSTWLKRVAG